MGYLDLDGVLRRIRKRFIWCKYCCKVGVLFKYYLSKIFNVNVIIILFFYLQIESIDFDFFFCNSDGYDYVIIIILMYKVFF